METSKHDIKESLELLKNGATYQGHGIHSITTRDRVILFIAKAIWFTILAGSLSTIIYFCYG